MDEGANDMQAEPGGEPKDQKDEGDGVVHTGSSLPQANLRVRDCAIFLRADSPYFTASYSEAMPKVSWRPLAVAKPLAQIMDSMSLPEGKRSMEPQR